MDLTLCFGGSFNPIHIGHLICAQAAAEAGGFNRVLLIPAGQSPLKTRQTDLAAPEHRLAMLQLAIQGSALFQIDHLELRRSGPSYTIETARELRRRGLPKVAWLIGADQVADLPKWHEPEALLNEVDFVLMARPGFSFDFTKLPPQYRGLEKKVVTVPQIDISSTDIRNRIRAGKPITYLTPPSVVDYIQKNRLYID